MGVRVEDGDEGLDDGGFGGFGTELAQGDKSALPHFQVVCLVEGGDDGVEGVGV